MAEPAVNFPDLEPLAKAVVSYLKSDTLFIQTNKPFLEGEEIARGVTVFYDKENENEVVGVMIDHAEDRAQTFRGRNPGQARRKPGSNLGQAIHVLGWSRRPSHRRSRLQPPLERFVTQKSNGSRRISPNPTAGLGALLPAPVLPDDLLHLGRAGQCHALSGTAPGKDSGM